MKRPENIFATWKKTKLCADTFILPFTEKEDGKVLFDQDEIVKETTDI